MADITEKIAGLVTPLIESHNAYLVEVVLRGERTSKVVEVYIDTDDGITSEQCADISREISEILDTADIIQGRYRLDVSSPDLGRPIVLTRQYKKNIGRVLKVVHNIDGEKKTSEGTLISVSDLEISLKINKKEEVHVSYSSIKEAFVIPQFK